MTIHDWIVAVWWAVVGAITMMVLASLTSCGIEVPSDTIRPIDDYCYEGLCGADQKCWRGECYDRCSRDSDCDVCCAKGEDTTVYYCAPAEVCE